MTDKKQLIYKEDVLAMSWLSDECEVVSVYDIEELHVVDAAPVVHGRWEDKPTGRYGKWQSWCSACGQHSGIGGIESNRHRAYCPNCGAKMEG